MSSMPSADSGTARPAAPYTLGIPAPPSIPIVYTQWQSPMKVVPRYDDIDPAELSPDDLAIITRNSSPQTADDSCLTWKYESRRQAQPILDFLYLGPSSIARDRAWLREHGITMVLAVRDTRQASLNLMAVDKVAAELRIEARYVDVPGDHKLVSCFPHAIHLINEHMLRIYHEQAVHVSGPDTTSMVLDESKFNGGKVLVVCETGNDRSASVVGAYLIAVFGMAAATALVFLVRIRFCVSLGEDQKNALRNFEDILVARRDVHQHEHQVASAPSHGCGLAGHGGDGSRLGAATRTTTTKRGIDTMQYDDEGSGNGGDGTMDLSGNVNVAQEQRPQFNYDHERFRDRDGGRAGSAPFIDEGY